MHLFDMTQSTLGQKPQWYAGEVVVLHQGQHSRAILRNDAGFITRWVSVRMTPI
jgi:hypothetical protein